MVRVRYRRAREEGCNSNWVVKEVLGDTEGGEGVSLVLTWGTTVKEARPASAKSLR